MKLSTAILLGALWSGWLFADIPEAVITTLSSANGHATVAGRLASKPSAPVGITVRNGNLVYSTLTDSEGRWGIVIRHLAVNVTVQAWSFSNGAERGPEVSVDLASALPWTETVSARESSSSETSAKYLTETSLRYRIDQKRSRCRSDEGEFSHYTSQMTCYKSGSTYTCSTSATCRCRPT